MSSDGKKYEWLLFDLDHTILDFQESSKIAFSKLLEDLALEQKDHFYKLYSSINYHVWYEMEAGKISQDEVRSKRFKLFFDIIGVSFDPLKANEIYFEHLSDCIIFMDNALMVLDALKSSYNFCIVTNGMKEVQRKRLANANLNGLFKHVVISDEIGFAKPQAQYFDHTLKTIQFTDRSKLLIIGDSLLSDIKGGVDYGIDTCWLNSQSIKSNETQIKPTYEIENLKSLLDFL